MAQNNTVESRYYSGQGVVLVSTRRADGTPNGFRNVGNVSALTISMETTSLEHKESSTGSRTTDLRLITENKATVTINMENFEAANLDIGLFGTTTQLVSAAVTDELTRATPGRTSITNGISISNVTVDRTADANATFTSVVDADTITIDGDVYTAEGTTGADAANKIFDASGTDAATVLSLVAVINAQTATLTYEARQNATTPARIDFYAITPGTAGNSLTLTESTVGARIVVSGATFANGGAATVTTDYVVNSEAGSIFLPATSAIPADTNIHIDYTHATLDRTDAFVAGQPEIWVRFEGLNTAKSNETVVVDIFKFTPDPLSEQQLIGDEVGAIEITGSALADTDRPAGTSQFFRQMSTPFAG
jgi:hypothetical protein